MIITVEIDDDELKQAVLDVIADRYYREFSSDRRHVDGVVSEAVRNIIYKDKERIVDKIVARASQECGNKAVKKLMEKVFKEDA